MPDTDPKIREHIEHSLNDVWTAVRKQGESVAEFRQGLSAISEGMADLRNELRAIRDFATRPSAPVNWVGVASLCVAILVFGGSYAQTVMSPVKETTKENASWITSRSNALREDYQAVGELKHVAVEALRIAENNALTLASARENISYQKGLLEATREQLSEIDVRGSRSWNTNERP